MPVNKKYSNIINHIESRLSWDEYFLSVAHLLSSRSSCERLKVGCVLVNNNRIISSGYNGFLPGREHKSIIRDNHEQATVHAEQNAIADCAFRGVNTRNSIAYVTHYPCIHCAKLLAASGITEIKYHCDYKNDPLVTEITKLKITQLL
jgi:dCMP deaminase